MNCPECGAENSDTATYCGLCQTKFGVSYEAEKASIDDELAVKEVMAMFPPLSRPLSLKESLIGGLTPRLRILFALVIAIQLLVGLAALQLKDFSEKPNFSTGILYIGFGLGYMYFEAYSGNAWNLLGAIIGAFLGSFLGAIILAPLAPIIPDKVFYLIAPSIMTICVVALIYTGSKIAAYIAES